MGTRSRLSRVSGKKKRNRTDNQQNRDRRQNVNRTRQAEQVGNSRFDHIQDKKSLNDFLNKHQNNFSNMSELSDFLDKLEDDGRLRRSSDELASYALGLFSIHLRMTSVEIRQIRDGRKTNLNASIFKNLFSARRIFENALEKPRSELSEEEVKIYTEALEDIEDALISQNLKGYFQNYVTEQIDLTRDYDNDNPDAVEIIANSTRREIIKIRKDSRLDNESKKYKESTAVFGLLLDLIDNKKVHFVSDVQTLARMKVQADGRGVNKNTIQEEVDQMTRNASRAFTDQTTGHIYMISGNNPGREHDLFHEVVHILSGEYGEIKLYKEQKTNILEGITEYFTKSYLRFLPINDAEAYPLFVSIIRTLSHFIGEDKLWETYFNDQGSEYLKNEIISYVVERKRSSGADEEGLRTRYSVTVNSLLNNFGDEGIAKSNLKRLFGAEALRFFT